MRYSNRLLFFLTGFLTIGSIYTTISLLSHARNAERPLVKNSATFSDDSLSRQPFTCVGKNILEVGSGIGTFTRLLIESNVEQIYALEPSKFLFPLLQKNLNNIDRVKELYYFDFLGAPLWFIQTKILKRTVQQMSPNLIKLFDAYVYPITLSIEKRLKPLFGKNLIAICEKP